MRSLAWRKGFRLGSGLTLGRLGLWLLVYDRPPPVRGVGVLLVVIAGISWFDCPLAAAAAVLSCRVQADRWVALHLVQRTPLWPASWLPAVDRIRGSKSVDVQRVWEVYDERLHCVSRQDAMQLDVSLDAGDVSRAWLVWSGAAETALVDAYRFGGGPLLGRGLVLGRGSASFRVVRLGGHRVRKARGSAADASDAADVFLCRDSSNCSLA